MSKSVLISIQPKWCELIVNGKKTVEVRKSRPKIETPFKVYIYCTLQGSNEFFKHTLNGSISKWNEGNWGLKKGKVIGEFVCDEITKFAIDPKYDNLMLIAMAKHSCLSKPQLENYASDYWLYGWYISDLVIYDKPRALSEFKGLRNTKFGYEPVEIKRPPQSWCYVEEDTENA